MSDTRPLGHAYGASPRIGYEQSNHALDWPTADGDELPGPPHDRNCRLMVVDAKGRVILEIWD